MKPRFFAARGIVKPSERSVIRKGGQRLEATIRGRNLRGIEYGNVLEIGLQKFFTVVMESGTSNLDDQQFRSQVQAAVRNIFGKWADEPPVKLWHWLKNRTRFNYTLEFKPEENQIDFQLGVQARLFCTGEINDFGEVISRFDLDRWDAAHKEKQDVQTSEADDGGLPGT